MARQKIGLHKHKIMIQSTTFSTEFFHSLHRFFHRSNREKPLKIKGFSGEG